jgi:hypothetical protein
MKLRCITTAGLIAALALGVAACSSDSGTEALVAGDSVVAAAPIAAAPASADAQTAPLPEAVDTADAGDAQQASDPHAAGPFIVADAELTEAEADGLISMREEEKLARDVYLALYEEWGLPVFDNITAAETKHTESVLVLIDAYGLVDPVTDNTPGVFTNPDFTALYNDLVEQGSESLVDALLVGALIEDLDIYDLQVWLELTENPDIERVYQNLLAGSENHMRAFVGQLESRGASYPAIYLGQSEIDEILASGTPRGGGGGGGRGPRG